MVGHGDQEGANELVDAYWRRREYLQSRQILVDERTAFAEGHSESTKYHSIQGSSVGPARTVRADGDATLRG